MAMSHASSQGSITAQLLVLLAWHIVERYMLAL
jgi:hypothetical protein